MPLFEEFVSKNIIKTPACRNYSMEMIREYGLEALSNRKLYDAIVEHRKTYYALKYVNYDLHAPSSISFTIPKSVMDAWQDDYADMRRFFIYGESLEFDALMQRKSEGYVKSQITE